METKEVIEVMTDFETYWYIPGSQRSKLAQASAELQSIDELRFVSMREGKRLKQALIEGRPIMLNSLQKVPSLGLCPVSISHQGVAKLTQNNLTIPTGASAGFSGITVGDRIVCLRYITVNKDDLIIDEEGAEECG